MQIFEVVAGLVVWLMMLSFTCSISFLESTWGEDNFMQNLQIMYFQPGLWGASLICPKMKPDPAAVLSAPRQESEPEKQKQFEPDQSRSTPHGGITSSGR